MRLSQKTPWGSPKVNWDFRENSKLSHIWTLFCARLWELRTASGLANLSLFKDPTVVLISYYLLGLNGWSTVSPVVHIITRTVLSSWATQSTHCEFIIWTRCNVKIAFTYLERENCTKLVKKWPYIMLAFALLVKWMEAMMWFIIIEKRCCQHGRVLKRHERFWSNKSDDNNKSDKNNSLLLSSYNVLVTILGSSYTWSYLIFITNLLV